MQHEVELKLELDPADVGALVEHPLLRSVQAQTKQQVSTYFDTKKRLLRRAGFSLRVRTSGGEHVQTIKLVAEGAGCSIGRNGRRR